MKKRYQVTLTAENVERFQALVKKLNMPASSMSSMLDDLLGNTVDSMEKFVKKGKATLADLFTIIGEQLEEVENEKQTPKTKRVAKKPTGRT